jgi:curli biogenesis system outer membrane secretion channel CsgG
MKTVIVSVATLFLISCGGSGSQVSSDSTSVDSTKVADSAITAVDSTVAQINSAKADTLSIK